MRKRLQRPESIVWIVVFAIAAIIGIAAAAVPPWPLGRPSREEASLWVTALTGAGTLAAVAVALWMGANAQREGERIRHDAVRPAITARMQWVNSPTMWLFVYNWAEYPALNLRITVSVVTPQVAIHRLPFWPNDDAPARAVVLLSHREEAETNHDRKQYIEYMTQNAIVAEGCRGDLILWYEDILGWTWENRVAVSFDTSLWPSERIDLDLGEPTSIPRRLVGWPDEASVK